MARHGRGVVVVMVVVAVEPSFGPAFPLPLFLYGERQWNDARYQAEPLLSINTVH